MTGRELYVVRGQLIRKQSIFNRNFVCESSISMWNFAAAKKRKPKRSVQQKIEER